MIDQNLVRGIVLAALSLAFGIGALQYPIGTFARAGPGMFPLMMSTGLFIIAVSTIVRSRMVKPVPLQFNPKNISLLLGSLCGFALISQWVNMIAGIVFMVFVAGFAAREYSWTLNLKIAAGLVAVAFAFQKLLGLSLPLY